MRDNTLPKFIYLNSRSRIGIYESDWGGFALYLEYRCKRKYFRGYKWLDATDRYPARNMKDVEQALEWLLDYRKRKIEARRKRKEIYEFIDKVGDKE